MTKIDELIKAGRTVSFEFFPPKTAEGSAVLRSCIQQLEAVCPSFVSVTYGAGGANRDTTRDLAVEIGASQTYPVMPHLTCIGHARSELQRLVSEYATAGIANILALAGDPPVDGSNPGGEFTYASELVELVRATEQFSIGVAAFPEGHPRSASLTADRRYLADKLGQADFGITQFFFRSADYFRMIDDLSRFGCSTPVIPGIMPMTNPESVRRFAQMNGAYFPEDLAAAVSAVSPADGVKIAVEAARELLSELDVGGIPGVHLYCLNRAEAALAILAP